MGVTSALPDAPGAAPERARSFRGRRAGAAPPEPAAGAWISTTSKRRPSTSAVKWRSTVGSDSGAGSAGSCGPGSSGGGMGVGSSARRASRAWQAPPAMNSPCSSSQRWNGIRVVGPSTTYSSRARIIRRRADSRSTSHTISLATIGS